MAVHWLRRLGVLLLLIVSLPVAADESLGELKTEITEQLPTLLASMQVPGYVVSVLQGEGRQRLVRAIDKLAVRQHQLVHQHVHAPPVGDNVVKIEQQHVLLFAKAQ